MGSFSYSLVIHGGFFQAELETLLLESQDREGQERVVMAVLRLQVTQMPTP